MFSFLKRFADNERSGSLSDRLRKKRFGLFLEMIVEMPRPVKVIDVGGTAMFWKNMGYSSIKGVKITLLNIKVEPMEGSEMMQGDARNLRRFKDKEFDIAFSNSVIEHLGTFDDQRLMAEEMKRVASKVYLQTPNRWFPLEPHTLFPFFQFLPLSIKVWLMMHFDLGWYKKMTDRKLAEQECNSIRLMSKSDLRILFPDAQIRKERILGLVKSFIILNR